MKKTKNLDDLFSKAQEALENAAKLSTKKRKKLPDSAFSAPNRSFPVNDCAHYTAALRLLNRSKLSDASKKKVRACINRKGKSLGCDGAKKDKADYHTYFTKAIEETIRLPEFETTLEIVEKSIKNPGADLKFDAECEE